MKMGRKSTTLYIKGIMINIINTNILLTAKYVQRDKLLTYLVDKAEYNEGIADLMYISCGIENSFNKKESLKR